MVNPVTHQFYQDLSPVTLILFLIVAMTIATGIVLGIVDAIRTRMNWRADPHGNPYKRFCRHCGQQQDWYEWNTQPPLGIGWENICPVMPRTPKCTHGEFR